MPISSRLVVFSPNWLGDAVMAIPCLDDLRRAWPDATIAVATRSHLAALFEMVEAVDEVLRLRPPGGRGGLGAAVSDARELKGGAFDVAILLPNSFRSAAIARLAGIPQRWGYATDARSWLLTRIVPKLRGGHQVEYYRRLLAELLNREVRKSGSPEVPESMTGDRAGRGFSAGETADGVGRGFSPGKTSDERITLRVPQAARERARALLAEHGWKPGDALVGMAPGAAYGTAKQWLPERFAQLTAELAAEGVRTVLMGSPGDRPVCERIELGGLGQVGRVGGLGPVRLRTPETVAQGRQDNDVWVPPASAGGRPDELSGSRTFGLPDCQASVINLAGRTNLEELAAVIAECRSFVTNDSGAMHVAAAVGVPITAIIGPTREWETGPLPAAAHTLVIGDVPCRPCMLRECPTAHECMQAVTVDRVKAAVIGQVAQR